MFAMFRWGIVSIGNWDGVELDASLFDRGKCCMYSFIFWKCNYQTVMTSKGILYIEMAWVCVHIIDLLYMHNLDQKWMIEWFIWLTSCIRWLLMGLIPHMVFGIMILWNGQTV